MSNHFGRVFSPESSLTFDPVTNTSSFHYARVQFQNSKFQKKIRRPHGDLNLDEIKNALRLLSVNGETNLMNLIRLQLDANCYSSATVNNL